MNQRSFQLFHPRPWNALAAEGPWPRSVWAINPAPGSESLRARPLTVVATGPSTSGGAWLTDAGENIRDHSSDFAAARSGRAHAQGARTSFGGSAPSAQASVLLGQLVRSDRSVLDWKRAVPRLWRPREGHGVLPGEPRLLDQDAALISASRSRIGRDDGTHTLPNPACSRTGGDDRAQAHLDTTSLDRALGHSRDGGRRGAHGTRGWHFKHAVDSAPNQGNGRHGSEQQHADRSGPR